MSSSNAHINYTAWKRFVESVGFMFDNFLEICSLWQYGLSSFQAGDTKLEIFLPKNQHTERKLLNFEKWINGKVSKSAKI